MTGARAIYAPSARLHLYRTSAGRTEERPILDAVRPIEGVCRYCKRNSLFSILEVDTHHDDGQFYGVQVAFCRCRFCKSALTLFQRTVFDERDMSHWKRIYPA